MLNFSCNSSFLPTSTKMTNLIVAFTILLFFVSSGVNGQLLASQFSDGGCSFPAPAANATNTLVNLATPQVYLGYFLSKSYAINYAKVFLGRDPSDWSEVNKMCYSVAFSGGLAIQSAYNESKVWINTITPQVNETYLGGLYTGSGTVRNNSDTTPRDNYTLTAVWSDGTNVLTVNCVLGQTQDWALWSANGPPPQWAKDLVLNMLQNNFNMNPDHAIDFTGECQNPPTYFTYILRALQNLGLVPKTYVRGLSGLLNSLGVVYIAALQRLYQILGIVAFPLIPPIGG